MARVLSGVQPSGDLHLGNYLGAFRYWVADQHDHDALFCVVDLHAMTLDYDPALLATRTLETAESLLAVGLDPEVCTLFVQSHVPEHPRLTWLLECTATFGELRRMTQFKDKGGEQETVRAALFTYPVLMAADILLYEAERVPVGEDQRQHLELARDVAIRFNHRYGQTFVVPEAAVPKVAARVMDLQEPTRKMSKSVSSPLGTVLVLDPPEEIDRKVRKAVTDTETEVHYDPLSKPGVSNLLELLGAATGGDPAELADRYVNYGQLKADVTEALTELLRPARERFAELHADRGYVESVLAQGAAKARALAGPTLDRAMRGAGLLAPPGGFSA
ncbi:MAG TPA: tryptophan--tRNA ligase [Acidimicrobiales bacterium]|nr:tryptophan--tRNA ligase [Acidimicrobiales bacterium]HLN42417.1 tryptophan--tRNA ligase [Acidimicrobiales bacterium]